MANILDIDDRELRSYTNKLEKMHRAALPNAVRDTLNNVAFDMKGSKGDVGLMQRYANKTFENERSRNFIKNLTVVNRARGFDIAKMESRAGINRNAPGRRMAAANMEAQETGGTLKHKSGYLPNNNARASRNPRKKIQQKKRLSRLPSNITEIRKRGDKRALIIAAKKGEKYVIYTKKYKTLFEITNSTPLELKPLYTFDDSYRSQVRKHSFVTPAGRKASSKIGIYYHQNAQKQIKKFMNR